LFQGAGHYLETLSVSIQVYATIYVTASFASLLSSVALNSATGSKLVSLLPVLKEFVKEPVLLFFLISSVLLLIYLPLALRSVHKFRWLQTTALFAVLAPLLILLFHLIVYPIYQKTGIMFNIR
jgi:hypothetical protein